MESLKIGHLYKSPRRLYLFQIPDLSSCQRTMTIESGNIFMLVETRPGSEEDTSYNGDFVTWCRLLGGTSLGWICVWADESAHFKDLMNKGRSAFEEVIDPSSKPILP